MIGSRNSEYPWIFTVLRTERKIARRFAKASKEEIVVEVERVIDVHYASLASPRVQHGVSYLDGHPSRYQPRPTGLNFGEQTETGVFPLVIAVPPCLYTHRSVYIFCLPSRRM